MIRLQKVGDSYAVSVSPPEGPTWSSPLPMSATDVLKKLSELGCHSTDITDALYDADPGWASKHDAHVLRRRELTHLPDHIKERILAFPEVHMAVQRVTVVLADGRTFTGVEVAWGDELIRVAGVTDVPFAANEVVDVYDESGLAE